MGIFSRKSRDVAPTTDSAKEDTEDGTDVTDDPTEAALDDRVGDVDHGEDADAVDEESDGAQEAPFNRTRGPFDASEVDGSNDDHIDLGSLRIPPVEGMQLRLELDEEQQNVVSAHALLADSGVQLQVFAAPRTLGVWPDIRGEIATSVTSQGGTAEVIDGPLGRELLARIPSRGQDGRTVQNPVRFLGVDGPRWFLRGVISGPAATDERKAAPLIELVRATVVVRDDQARPPREALPMHVPVQPETDEDTVEAADTVDTGENAEAPSHVDDSGQASHGSTDDLTPFERGPEITEVR